MTSYCYKGCTFEIKLELKKFRRNKTYSVFPLTGEQCTTTVKTAIQQAFPNLLGSNYVTDTTQTPQGLLEELRSVISTSKEHSGELTKITIIKNEAIDYH